MEINNSYKENIEKAKAALPENTRKAIDSIDWKKVIFEMKTEKGFNFNQIEALGIQTELLLCGLLDPSKYSKELKKQMGLTNEQVNDLVNEINEKIFKRIREELIRNTEEEGDDDVNNEEKEENEEAEEPKELKKLDTENKENINKPVIAESREELIQKIENPPKTLSILNQKLSGTFQIPKVETDHTISNITKVVENKIKLPRVDPYREPVE